MAQKQITDGHPDGIVIFASGDKGGFFGKTAITRRSAPASIGATATSTVLKTAVNKLRNELVRLGLIAAQ